MNSNVVDTEWSELMTGNEVAWSETYNETEVNSGSSNDVINEWTEVETTETEETTMVAPQ